MISATTISPLNRRIVDGFDTNAQAFINAAGITGATQQEALNQLVLDLKGKGTTTNNTDVWGDLDFLYPMCPIDSITATLTAFSFNLINTNKFQVTWFNSPSASQSGFVGNRPSGSYGATSYIPSDNSLLNNHMYGYFGTGTSLGEVMGCSQGSNNPYNTTNGIQFWGINSSFNSTGLFVDGFNLIQRTSFNNSETYVNSSSISVSSAIASSSIPTIEYYLGARNLAGFASSSCGGIFSAFFAGSSLSVSKIQDLLDSLTTYNTSLGR